MFFVGYINSLIGFSGFCVMNLHSERIGIRKGGNLE